MSDSLPYPLKTQSKDDCKECSTNPVIAVGCAAGVQRGQEGLDLLVHAGRGGQGEQPGGHLQDTCFGWS